MKKIPVMPKPERRKEPTPTSIKVVMSVIAAIALLLLLLTFMDMSGLHLLMPELIPMGCVLEVLLLLTWLAMIVYRRRTDDHKKRIVMLVSALIIMVVGLFLSTYVLQYAQVLMPTKYGVIKAPTGKKIAILSLVDNGFGSNEETLAMLSRMEERQAAIRAKADGVEYDPSVLPEVPAAVKLDENGEIIYNDGGIVSYSLDAYDYEAYGYIYTAYPIKLGLFYTSNVPCEGLIYRGVESEAKILYDWLDDTTLSLYLDTPQPGDSGKVTLHTVAAAQ